MTDSEQQLASLLQQADSAMSGEAAALLDGESLVRQAAARARKRMTGRAMAVGLLIGAGITTVVVRQSATDSTLVAADPATDITKLAASIEELETEANALLVSVGAYEQPTFDILSALSDEQRTDKESLAHMQAELSALESRVAAGPIEWNIEWSRSGALRLELARIEARFDQPSAASAYRRIATTYAGTRWGDEAQLALNHVAGP